MRVPVSGRDAIRSRVIYGLEAQEVKETGNEEGQQQRSESSRDYKPEKKSIE
jgi:hypothetical protein